MDRLKEFADGLDNFQVITSLKQEYKDRFPDTPEDSPEK